MCDNTKQKIRLQTLFLQTKETNSLKKSASSECEENESKNMLLKYMQVWYDKCRP